MLKFIVKNSNNIYLALIAFAISLGFSFQLANLSSILRFMGVNSESLPLFWIVPPLTGLIMQPIVGQLSDATVTKFGKRRPYIIGWGILACLSLFYASLANSFLVIIMLICLIDCSLNGSLESLRALTGDLTNGDTERSQAFALQAVFSGIGGALGAALPYLLQNYTGAFHAPLKLGKLPYNIKASFIIAALIILATVVVALFIKEKKVRHERLFAKKVNLLKVSKRIFVHLCLNIKNMPPKFKRVCLIHSLSWIGVFIFWLYFTTTLASNLYGLSYNADFNDGRYTSLLHKASLDSSYYFSLYQYVSILYSLVLYLFSNRFKIHILHAIALFIGGSSIALICFATSSFTLTCSMIGIGIMWGSLLVLPYTIAMEVIPKSKIGIYLGIFNMSITAPQILSSLVLAHIFNVLIKNYIQYALIISGIFVITSGIFWIRQECTFKLNMKGLRKLNYYSSSE